jgi:hypothetical protein
VRRDMPLTEHLGRPLAVLALTAITVALREIRNDFGSGFGGSYAAGSIRVVMAIRFQALITVIAHTS